jgi:heparin binding hemagglutinin HbhA
MATTTRKIPTPLYAAAGAGDIAYRQLRKLPEQVAQLRGRVSELRPVVSEAVAETNLDKIRDVARRNADALVSGAQVAQERATAVYKDLVARGQKIVDGAQPTGAAIEVAPAAGTVTAITGTSAAGKPVAKKTAAKKATPAK